MEEEQPGIYAADLPTLDPAQDYCIRILDMDTGSVNLSQLVDGHACPIAATKGRVGARPAPRNASPGGLTFCIRTGRQVELE